jgi:hypothetical protein
VLASGLLVVHDAVRGGQDEVTELTRGQNVRGELLDVVEADVESGGDDAALVEATDQVNDDLAGSVIIDDLEFTNVAVLLHDLQEADDDLRGGSDEDLSLSGLLGVDHRVKAVSQNGDSHHVQSITRPLGRANIF